jgi:hypothetical protein
MIRNVIGLIFEGLNVDKIVNAIEQGNINQVKQEYAKASFNYYMGKKKDEGVLYISLSKDPIMTVFFKDADELAASGLRLHAGTVYITSVADVRLPYPQMEIVDTKGSTFDPNGTGGEPAPDVDVEPTPVPKAISGEPIRGIRPKSAPSTTPAAGVGRARR